LARADFQSEEQFQHLSHGETANRLSSMTGDELPVMLLLDCNYR
jgi:hypothetical protein